MSTKFYKLQTIKILNLQYIIGLNKYMAARQFFFIVILYLILFSYINPTLT